MIKILLTWQGAVDALPRLRAALPADCEFLVPPPAPELDDHDAEAEEIVRLAAAAEVIMGWHVPRQAILAAERLRLLSWLHAGCDSLDLALLRDKGVQVCNVRGANAGVVAEHGLAFMLGLAKRLVANDRMVKNADWVKWSAETASVTLEGRSAAIIGMGQVGSELARRCKAFGMTVIGLTRHGSGGEGPADEVHAAGALMAILPRADFVVLTLPLTAETKGVIGAEQLAAMKRGAFLVNLGRGHLVREAPLLSALTQGRIAGFASDVWWDYPPSGYHYAVPSRLGVHRLPNVLASGNAAANEPAVRQRMIDCGIADVARFLRGEKPERPVDLDLGY